MKSLSGKFVLRVPEEMHMQLNKLANDTLRSLNATCIDLIERQLKFDSKVNEAETPFTSIVINHYKETMLGLIVFGSYTREETTKSSDIDVLVVLDDKVNITRSLYKDWEVNLESKVRDLFTMEVSPHFANLSSNNKLYNNINPGSLWLEIAFEGKILWEKKDVVSKMIRKIRLLIAEGIYQRRISHGHPYWVNNK